MNALSDTKRNEIISRDYASLRSDLSGLMSGRSIPIVIIKANVCRVLEPKLIGDGFNVLNKGDPVYFPSSGQQKEFQHQFATVVKRTLF